MKKNKALCASLSFFIYPLSFSEAPLRALKAFAKKYKKMGAKGDVSF